MSVQEMIEQLGKLSREERDELRAALAAIDMLPAGTGSGAAEAFDRLARGWCHGGGRPVADTADEALYGRQR